MWIRSDADTLFNIEDATKIEVKSGTMSDITTWTVTANFSRTPDGAKTSSYARNNPDEIHIFRGENEEQARTVFMALQSGLAKGTPFLDLTELA